MESEKKTMDLPRSQEDQGPPFKTAPRFVRTDQQVEERFHKLLNVWRSDTAVESVLTRLIFHPAFRGIAGLGPQAVPHILRELERGKNVVWLHILEDITGENPVPPEHKSNGRLMLDDWLIWGRKNGAL